MKQIISFVLLFLLCIQVHAQERKVTGVVTSGTNNEPLTGVSVSIKGTSNGAITDIDGKYSITVPDENTVLVFTYIGYVKEETTVGGKSIIDLKLAEDLTKLDEVVVVGYGVQKKSLVTGAISKVSGDDLTRNANLRASQILQGQAAGVIVTNNSGQPGSGVSIRIRGIGTNGSAEPLYIIDGLPTSDAGLDFLSPMDIESMEVLKDAASCAIYGARGAGGVVLITTKKGKSGAKQVSYDGYYGVANPWRKLDMLNSKEYMTVINEAAANANKPAVFSTAFMAKNQYNTDWQDQMFNYNAPIQNHNLSISGGDEKSSYYSTLSYFGQDGIVAKGKSNFKRISYHLNATRKLGLLEIGSSINFANITNKGIDVNNQYGGSSLIQALNTPPIVPVKNPDGSWGTPSQPGIGLGMQEISNPVAMLNYLNQTTNTNKGIGGVYGEFDFGKLADILKGLKFRSSFNVEYSFVNGRSYTPDYYVDATHQVANNGVSENIDRYNTWNIDNVLTYDKTIKNHHFTLMLGQSAYEYTHTNVSGSRNQVIFNDLDHAYLDNAQATNASAGGGFTDHTLASLFGRLNYDYNNKYLVTAIVRRDGSSRFGTNNKYGTFPSVSLGWVLSREDFMKDLTMISFMKLRGSWGQNGSEEIGDFRYTSTISTNNIYYFGSDKTQYNGAQPSAIANPNIKWEASEQLDLGLDVNLFNNKVNLTLDYYKKNTKDWLVQAPIPAMMGNSAPTVNGGNIQNSGVEFELGYKNDFRKFHFEASVLGGFNKNKVVDIPNLEKTVKGGNGGFGQGGIIVFTNGQPAGSFYGVKTDGLFQNWNQINAYTHANTDGTTSLIQPNAVPGDVKFIDQDGNGKIDDKDRVNLGNPTPDFTGGIKINMSWIGFDFNTFLYASLGSKIWDATRRFDINYANYRSDALNRWIGEGSSNSIPRVTLNDVNGNWSTASDMFVKDASFVRLKSITLGYTLPIKVSQYIKIQKFRIYISGENLLTFTKYRGFDPEIGGGVFGNGVDYGNYPQARTILGGVNITF